MKSFARKIFENEIDEIVHLQFQKFSRGNFKDRAMIKSKSSNNGISINTTHEFANDFVRMLAEKAGVNKIKVSGGIISTADLTGKIKFSDKKQFMGVKQYVIDNEMSGNEIIKLLDEFPECFFALSFKFADNELKIKPKAPKSAKPSTKTDEKPKIDFCKLITNNLEFAKNFVFEKDFKNAEIRHEFVIEEIILPKGINDPAELRKQAKRKGKIIRKAIIDGKEIISEKEFVA